MVEQQHPVDSSQISLTNPPEPRHRSINLKLPKAYREALANAPNHKNLLHLPPIITINHPRPRINEVLNRQPRPRRNPPVYHPTSAHHPHPTRTSSPTLSLSTHINPKLTAPRTNSHLQPRPHQPLPSCSYRRRFRGVEVVAGRKGAAACGCTRRGREFFDEEGRGSGEGGFGVGGGHGLWAFGEGRGW